MKKLLNEIDAKKAVGIDTIPPNLIKIASNYLAPILTTAISSSIENSVPPANAKVATVVPLDKGKPDKNDISNFRPVSLLNTFSKFYEIVIKDQLVLSMENYFSPMVSAYRKNYSTQHVITRLIEEWRAHLDENFVVGAVLTDLSKAFDCIAHDLLIAKLAAYGFSDTALRYVYSYLSNQKQCVRINNMYSNYQKIISGVPQGSISGPIVFNLSINDLFFFVSDVSLHNFADTSAFAETILELTDVLQSGSEIVIDWFKNNKMIVDPDKLQVTTQNQRIVVDNQNIKVVSSADFLGIQINNKLNFNVHISNICRSAANQLNALIRLKRFLGFKEKRILINSYFIANFNYCPLVWMFSSASSLKKIEKLQKRALRFLYNDYEISYEELLLKSGRATMNVNRLRILCIEIYKTINNLNPEFMRDLFSLRETSRLIREKYMLNLNIPVHNQVTFGTKNLRFFGPKVWNSLP